MKLKGTLVLDSIFVATPIKQSFTRVLYPYFLVALHYPLLCFGYVLGYYLINKGHTTLSVPEDSSELVTYSLKRRNPCFSMCHSKGEGKEYPVLTRPPSIEDKIKPKGFLSETPFLSSWNKPSIRVLCDHSLISVLCPLPSFRYHSWTRFYNRWPRIRVTPETLATSCMEPMLTQWTDGDKRFLRPFTLKVNRITLEVVLNNSFSISYLETLPWGRDCVYLLSIRSLSTT